MILFALRDQSVDELIEFFPTRAIAEETLAEILADEPQWRELLDLVPVELEFSPN